MVHFVYFDVGGVAILDFSGTDNWTRLKQDLGLTPEKFAQFDKFWQTHEHRICLGENVEELLPLMQKELNIHVPAGFSLLQDGFVRRFRPNPSIHPVITHIHKICGVGLLTNMYTGMFTTIKSAGILPDIHWDIIIDSSIEKVQKPDPKIFQLAEKKCGFSGQEILFVENSIGNITAASNFGWQTFLYDPQSPSKSSEDLLNLFSK